MRQQQTSLVDAKDGLPCVCPVFSHELRIDQQIVEVLDQNFETLIKAQVASRQDLKTSIKVMLRGIKSTFSDFPNPTLRAGLARNPFRCYASPPLTYSINQLIPKRLFPQGFFRGCKENWTWATKNRSQETTDASPDSPSQEVVSRAQRSRLSAVSFPSRGGYQPSEHPSYPSPILQLVNSPILDKFSCGFAPL